MGRPIMVNLHLHKQCLTGVFLLALGCSAPALAQLSLDSLFRSVAGAIKPKEEKPPPQGVTAVLGVRGIDDAEKVAGGPAAEDYRLMETWTVSTEEAGKAAASRQLTSRMASLRSAAASSSADKAAR